MLQCAFCNIVAKKEHAYIVYEDRDVLAFLDTFPVVEGHTLIIPKKHVRSVIDIEEFGEFWKVAQIVGKMILRGLRIQNVIFSTSGKHILHAHVHVMPQPDVKTGEFLPGVESARRLSVTKEELTSTAKKLQQHL